MSGIHFIITGGTIDSVYHPPIEKAVPAEKSIIPSYLNDVIKAHTNITFETICMLDSSDITDQNREDISKAILASDHQKVIVTHGTNTMTETASYLDSAGVGESKTVVLVGSMIPLKEFTLSDGGFNLGYAIAEVQRLEKGVYVCMNAKTFKAGNVQKVFEKARFE